MRGSVGRLWQAVPESTRLDPMTVKTFLAFGMLLNTGAALDLAEVDEQWVRQAETNR